jgi:hypothetical protein
MTDTTETVGPAAGGRLESITGIRSSPEALEWEADFRPFRDRHMLMQLLTGIVMPAGILAIVAAVVSHWHPRLGYVICGLAALPLLLLAATVLLRGGVCHIHYRLDRAGIVREYARNGLTLARLLAVAAAGSHLFHGKFGAAFAGLAAMPTSRRQMPWRHVRKAKFKPARSQVVLNPRGRRETTIYCDSDHYFQVENAILQSFQSKRTPPADSPR